MMGSDVVLHPSIGPAPHGALSFYFYIRPNTLVKDSLVASIKAIDRLTGTITLSAIPSGYGDAGVKFDLIKAKSPHNILAIDISGSVGSNSITVNPSLIPKDLEVGDFMPLASQSCIPNVPTELHSVLAQRVAQRVLEALGDTEGLGNATAKIAEMESKLNSMMSNRVEGAPRKVVNRSLMTGVARNRRGY
jgi:hypothetical protein